MTIACPEPHRSAKAPEAEEFIGGTASARGQGESSRNGSRFLPTFATHKVKRAPSPFAPGREGVRRVKQKPISWKRIALISGVAVLVALLITGITLITPKRPVVYVKRVSVPSTSLYSVAASGATINVSGHGTLSLRLLNPNWLLRQTVKEVSVDVFWVGYQGDDKDYFETAPLAAGAIMGNTQFTLYPKDALDTTVETDFEHTGVHNVDPIWLDFVRRCLNQDEESRHMRLLFRVSLVVRTGWWGERRRRYLLPQDLPCPMTTTQIVQLFRNMNLPPPEQAQLN